MRDIHISAVSQVCGELRKVSQLATASNDLAPLVADIVHFRESALDIWELAAKSAEATVQQAAAEPDLVLYVSENDPDVTGSLARILDRLGLTSVEHLALRGQDCGNLPLALQAASDALGAGWCTRVLLILADSALAGSRLMASGLSVFSDSAVSCVVTAQPPATTRPLLRVTGRSTRTEVRTGEKRSEQHELLTTVRLAAQSVEGLLKSLSLRRADFRYAVLPNYRPEAQKFLLTAMKMPPQSLLLGPVTELAHCFSADVLITLDRHAVTGALSPGDRVMASVSGPHSCSTLAVECLTGG
ncbi:hypothetical protein ACFWPV_15615 [Streptomyces uncialis]|uniref:hypothetical protein n=1 Tax=Streptomyces uncialis TaxID=1048205 RepID=UPI00364D3EF6